MPKIAVAQIEVFDEIDKNLEKIIGFIEKASAGNADIVCFPESCLWDTNTVFDIGSHEIKMIQNKCKEKSIYCIFGVHLKQDNKVFNSAVLVNRLGEIQYIYKKTHPFPGLDLKQTVPGNENKVIETDFGKIGIIICWDFAFQEDIKKLSKSGAQIIFCPAYLLNDAKISGEVFRSLPVTRAFENLSYFVTCDAFTDETFSESFICSPQKILNKIQNKEG
ncbi:MAG: carbon-nitrogen hydrolase family protein, partial [Candidatus Aenigmarchaeota archaeon]|nr:carbon-nitrogen hydrolase family protein [Candidatus Aenigmarchaeota archaeon]